MKFAIQMALAGSLAMAAVFVTTSKISGNKSSGNSSRPVASESGSQAGRSVGSRRREQREVSNRRMMPSVGGMLTVAGQREELRLIRDSDDQSTKKVTALWALLPRLDEPAIQVEAAGFLASLIEDERFQVEVGSYLLVPDRPKAVSEAFMLNLLDRPVEIGKPLADAIVVMGDHPLREYAERILQQAGDLNR